MAVTIKGLDSCIKGLRAVGADIPQIVDKELQASADELTGAVKDTITALGAVDTGNLRERTASKKLGLCKYAVINDAEYAVPVEFGTGDKGDPAVAHTTREKWVYHNPTVGFRTAYPHPPRPFMRSTFAQKRDKITDNVRQAIIKAASDAWKGGSK